MKLYILRHGDAVTHMSPDSERPLSSIGEQEVASVAQRCAERLKNVEQVISSPYLRARQTAAILLRTLSGQFPDYTNELLINPLITPAGQLHELGVFIEALDSDEVLLVSHQPLVGNLITFLTADDAHGAITTANLAALDVSAFARGGAELLWLERPE